MSNPETGDIYLGRLAVSPQVVNVKLLYDGDLILEFLGGENARFEAVMAIIQKENIPAFMKAVAGIPVDEEVEDLYDDEIDDEEAEAA